MGILDSISGGPDDLDRDGNEDLDNENDDDTDENDPDGNDSGNDDDGNDDDGKDDRKRRRNRPGSVRRDRDRVRSLETKFDQLVKLIEKGGLAVNVPKEDDKPDLDKLRKEIEAEVTGKANARVVRSEARAALREAGFRGDVARGVRMLDLDGIDVDDPDAILDAIEDLKDDSPELFTRVRRNRPSRDDDDETDRGSRTRESRPARSRERITRGSGEVSETDSLAAGLISAIGGSRRERR